jgi:copper chaperone
MTEATKTVKVPNISCGHCVMAIEKEIGAVDGVKGVTASVDSKDVTVIWDAPASWDKIKATLQEIGYPAAE